VNLFIASHYVFENIALLSYEYIMITYTTGRIRPPNNFHPTRRLAKKVKADNKIRIYLFLYYNIKMYKKYLHQNF